MNDYYAILGVSPDATPDEIKAAFRQLAHEHHPDHDGNEEKFKKINEAHDILSDPDKRRKYDHMRFLLAPRGDGPLEKPQSNETLVRTSIVERLGMTEISFIISMSSVNIVTRDCVGILASEYVLVTASGTREHVMDFFERIERWLV